MKATWKIINQLSIKKSTSINNLNFDGREILQKDTIASSMSKCFCSIGNDLANEILIHLTPYSIANTLSMLMMRLPDSVTFQRMM